MEIKSNALAGMAIKDDDIEKVSGGSLEDIRYTEQDKNRKDGKENVNEEKGFSEESLQNLIDKILPQHTVELL